MAAKTAQKTELPLPVPGPAPPNSGHKSKPTNRLFLALILCFAVCLGLIYIPLQSPPSLNIPRTGSQLRNPAYLIEAQNGAVASENVRCSEMGVKIMKEGGNAVDAAVTSSLCIGVVNMFS